MGHVRALGLVAVASLTTLCSCSADSRGDSSGSAAAPSGTGGVGAPGAGAGGVHGPGGDVGSGGRAGVSMGGANMPVGGSSAADAGGAPAGRDAGGAPKTDSGSMTDGSSNGGHASACMGPIGAISGALATGVILLDTDGERVNAHGGGIIREGDTFYMHGEFFSSTTTDNNFNGFSMYSSVDLATWKNEGIILPRQADGELGPNRKGERPHIIKCPSTGEFVLYAHAASADYQTDKEVVYATSDSVNGQYTYRGPLENAGGQIAAHSDMSAYADDSGAYVLTESGHVYTLAGDCHSWLSDKTASVNGDSGGSESPTLFQADGTYYWIGSYKTGWRANNNFYSTAPAITGPWTYQGFVAPVSDPGNNLSDERTWLSQSTWVQPVVGCEGTVYVYWGDHWDGNLDTTAPGKHNALATYVLQPLVVDGAKISLPTYHESWSLDVGAGTWAPIN